MPFDDAKYYSPARQGDVGYGMFLTADSIRALAKAIEKLAAATNVDCSPEMATLAENARTMQDDFNRLTGWKPE